MRTASAVTLLLFVAGCNTADTAAPESPPAAPPVAAPVEEPPTEAPPVEPIAAEPAPVEPPPAPAVADPAPAAAVVPEPAPAVIDDPATVIPSTSLGRRVVMKLKGTYVHAGSGISFPAAAAGFARVMPQQYDREGNDVGIGYARVWMDGGTGFTAQTTIYVYPAQRRADGTPVPFGEQFDGEVASLRHRWTEASEVRRVESDPGHRGQTVHVCAAEFTTTGAEGMPVVPMVTILAAFRRGPWHVTYRATVPAAHRDACLAAFEELVATLGLPPTGLPAQAQ